MPSLIRPPYRWDFDMTMGDSFEMANRILDNSRMVLFIVLACVWAAICGYLCGYTTGWDRGRDAYLKFSSLGRFEKGTNHRYVRNPAGDIQLEWNEGEGSCFEGVADGEAQSGYGILKEVTAAELAEYLHRRAHKQAGVRTKGL